MSHNCVCFSSVPQLCKITASLTKHIIQRRNSVSVGRKSIISIFLGLGLCLGFFFLCLGNITPKYASSHVEMSILIAKDKVCPHCHHIMKLLDSLKKIHPLNWGVVYVQEVRKNYTLAITSCPLYHSEGTMPAVLFLSE